jgi:hypothetical protein
MMVATFSSNDEQQKSRGIVNAKRTQKHRTTAATGP